MRYGVGLVFHGERSSPYGLVMLEKPRAPVSTGVYAQRPVVTTLCELFVMGLPNQSSPKMGESHQS